MSKNIKSKYIKPNDPPLLEEAFNLVVETQKASTGQIQRYLKLGYNAAAELMKTLEKRKVVSQPIGCMTRRKVLVNPSMFEISQLKTKISLLDAFKESNDRVQNIIIAENAEFKRDNERLIEIINGWKNGKICENCKKMKYESFFVPCDNCQFELKKDGEK